jgi:hypothetical protein
MEGTTAVLVILERRISVALLANRERFVPGVMPNRARGIRRCAAVAVELPDSVR